MGVVYHGNYAQYLELARLAWLDDLGISYKWMEAHGVMLPVYKLEVSFLKSATFDDTLKVIAKVSENPSVRITFDYEIYNQNDELLTTAMTQLIFINTTTNRPMRCPDYILEKLV